MSQPLNSSLPAALKLRGVELHGHSIWRWNRIERLLEYMLEHEFNALFLHQNNLLNRLVHFSKHYPPTLEDLNHKRKLNNIFYMRRVAQTGERLGIKLYFEIKELEYEDRFLQLHPELYTAPGIVCPSHPLWKDLLAAKVEEVCENVPELAGIVFTFAAPESRLWLAHSSAAEWEKGMVGKCTCDRCRTLNQIDWYEDLLWSGYRPLTAAGKQMVVREFAYSPSQQQEMLAAIKRLPDDVIAGIKISPHDFWPTYPNNPVIGQTGDHPQWLEFDAWGETQGWSIVPCYRVEEFGGRLRYAVARGAEGFWCRAEWEVVSEDWIFDTLNEVNLFAMACLGQNPEITSEEILHDWLCEKFGDEVTNIPLDSLHSLLLDSLEVIKKALYVRGHVFTRHSLMPLSVRQAWWSMIAQDYIGKWVPEKEGELEPTPENLKIIFDEKDEALALARKLLVQAGELCARENFPSELRQILLQPHEYLVLHVKGLQKAAKSVFWEKHLSEKENPTAEEITRGKAYVDELRQFAAELRTFNEQHVDLPHYVRFFFDPSRPIQLAADIESRIRALSS